MTAPKLLPCPFCGSEAEMLGGPMAQDCYDVWCKSKQGRHHLRGTMDPVKTAERWNTRALATPDQIAAQTDLKAADAQIELLLKNHNGLTAEIARLTAALATAREDGMREVKEIKPTQAQIDDACLSYRHDYGLMTPANRALMRFEATEWLLAWGKTITKGAAT